MYYLHNGKDFEPQTMRTKNKVSTVNMTMLKKN